MKKAGTLKKNPGSLKRGGTIKKKPVSEEKKKERQEDIDRMWAMFMEIWKERPHRSEISGKPLGSQPLSWMFDHGLEKSRYPKLKYEKDNIILCTFEEHQAKTNGFPLPKHQELIEQIKVKYNIP